MASRESARATGIAAVLIGLCAFAATVRLSGLDRLLPHLPEPDTFLVLQMQSLRRDPAMIPHEAFYERYPLLIARSLAVLPVDLPSQHIDADAPLDVRLRAAAHPYLEVRTLSAWMGVLLVPLTWLLVRRFLGPSGALWAAFFVATSILHILYSQQARPHVAHATLALIAVLAALAAHDRPTWSRTLAAGAAAGLALACLQSGAFALPPLFVGLWLSPVHQSARARGALRALVALVVALAIALPFYPTLPSIEDGSIVLAQHGGHSMELGRFNGEGFGHAVRLLWMHDPCLVVLCSAGAVVSLVYAARRWRGTDKCARGGVLVVLAYAVPYGLVIGFQSEIFERLLIPLLPYIAGLSAAVVVWILALATRALRSSAQRVAALSLGAVCIAAFPAYVALHYACVAAAPDTLEQTAAWFESGWREDPRNPDPSRGAIATNANLHVPLLYTSESLAVDTADPGGAMAPWLAYQRLIPRAAGEPAREHDRYDVRLFPSELALEMPAQDDGQARRWLESVRPQFAVLELTPKMVFVPMLAELRAAVLARGELVFRSKGDDPEMPRRGPINYQDVRYFVPRILHTSAFGPGIEVYRLTW